MRWYQSECQRSDRAGTGQGYVNLEHVAFVERTTQPGRSLFGYAIQEPVAILVLAGGGGEIRLVGWEANRLFRWLAADSALAQRLTPPEGVDVGQLRRSARKTAA
jgi:hypothetical protein